MIDDSLAPSLAVAVFKDNEIIWQEAIGFSDIESSEKATIHSIYPIGSVSKSITATGMINLVNQNRISLMDDIRPILAPVELKNRKGESPPILLWQLLSMNGGINHGFGSYDSTNLFPKTIDDKKKF